MSEQRNEGNGVRSTRDALETGQEALLCLVIKCAPTIKLMDEPVQTFPVYMLPKPAFGKRGVILIAFP